MMKCLLRRRFLPTILCMALALGLSALFWRGHDLYGSDTCLWLREHQAHECGTGAKGVFV